MKIAIDVQTTLGKPTGFGFYVSNLVENLKNSDAKDDFVLIKPDSEVDFSTPKRFVWDQLTLPRLAGKHKVDLLHQPCFSAPFIFKGPVVITIHDIISILFPENIPFASRMFYSKWMPFSYRKATKIITISHSTQNDIVRVLKIPKEKITVIHNGVDEKFKIKVSAGKIKEVKAKYKIPGDYILHIGTLEPRKNLGFLIDAFSKAIADRKNQSLNLVVTGKRGWYFEDLFEKVAKLGLKEKVIFTGYVDEDDKAALYQGARIFAFPSLYEGFGLPPLEAMVSGIPVISSDTSSMPEVVGDAGILLKPNNLEGWVKAITKINGDDEFHKQLSQKSEIQADGFSWKKTAQQTIDVYHQAIREYRRGG